MPAASRLTPRSNGSSTRLADSVTSRTSSMRSTSIAEGWIWHPVPTKNPEAPLFIAYRLARVEEYAGDAGYSGMDLAGAFARCATGGLVRASGADAFEQDGGGLVVGVLGDEAAFEGCAQDRPTQPVRVPHARLNG